MGEYVRREVEVEGCGGVNTFGTIGGSDGHAMDDSVVVVVVGGGVGR